MFPEHKKILQKIIDEISDYLGQRTKVSFINSLEDPTITLVNLSTSDPAFLLAEGGSNLIAWQHICRIIFFKRTGVIGNFVIDINNYRHDRQQYLADLAIDTAQKVSAENRLVILKPMNSYERRIIHLTLAQDKRVATESLGEAEESRGIKNCQNSRFL